MSDFNVKYKDFDVYYKEFIDINRNNNNYSNDDIYFILKFRDIKLQIMYQHVFTINECNKITKEIPILTLNDVSNIFKESLNNDNNKLIYISKYEINNNELILNINKKFNTSLLSEIKLTFILKMTTNIDTHIDSKEINIKIRKIMKQNIQLKSTIERLTKEKNLIKNAYKELFQQLTTNNDANNTSNKFNGNSNSIVKPVEPAKPKEPVKPVEPVTRVKPGKAVETGKPKAPVKSSKVMKRNPKIINFNKIPSDHHEYFKKILNNNNNSDNNIRLLVRVFDDLLKMKEKFASNLSNEYKYIFCLAAISFLMNLIKDNWDDDNHRILKKESDFYMKRIQKVTGALPIFRRIGWENTKKDNDDCLYYGNRNSKEWTTLIAGFLEYLHEFETKDTINIPMNKDCIGICPGKCGLKYFRTPNASYSCDGCNTPGLPKDTVMYGCRKCNFDLCSKCMGTSQLIGNDDEIPKILADIFPVNIEYITELLKAFPGKTFEFYALKFVEKMKNDIVIERERAAAQMMDSHSVILESNPGKIETISLIYNILNTQFAYIMENPKDMECRHLELDPALFGGNGLDNIIGFDTLMSSFGWNKVTKGDEVSYEFTGKIHFAEEALKLLNHIIRRFEDNIDQSRVDNTDTTQLIVERLLEIFPGLNKDVLQGIIKMYPKRTFEFYVEQCMQKQKMLFQEQTVNTQTPSSPTHNNATNNNSNNNNNNNNNSINDDIKKSSN